MDSLRGAQRDRDAGGVIRVRILHLSTRLIVGGSQENTLLSCRGAADAGHQVGLAFGPIYGPEGSLLNDARSDARVECIEIDALTREVSPLADLRGHRQVRRLIRSWKPDVVHTHSSKAGILGRAAAWHEGVACIVHTIHGLAFHPRESSWRNWIYARAERWAARRCHAIVSVADAMTVQALAARIGEPSQYTTIRSGIDVDALLAEDTSRARIRAELGIDEGDIVFGTFARLAEHKGHDDLIDALTPLLASRDGPPMRLLWVGDGWWRARLGERLRGSSIANRVILTGLVEPSRIGTLLAATDVVIHPSYREGLPRAVVQGLLAGKPAIAYDIDGAREVCVPGETGILVNPGDLDGLRRGAKWMIAHPHERRAMGARGNERFRTEFDWRVMSQRLLALYSRILASSGRAVE